MLPVVFGPAARAETLEAADWYRSRSPALAERFLTEVETVVARIADNPEQYPVMLRDARRARLRRFPYALFFRSEGGIVHVIACFHASRDPRRWQGQI